MKLIINAPNAPKPIGPYSHSVKTQGPLLFISGQIAIDNDGNMVGIDIATQTSKVLENLGIILENAGCTYDDVAKCTVLLKNMEDFSEMNSVYARYFENSKPARAAYQVSQLPKDALVEIEAIAVVPSELEN